ncbi:MAG: SH3 domain-containing protein [Deltaproteobacteria bacterium]|nr:SH3 domain-containing protein [Candidatus Zymogenaceae bacterium]
MFIKLSRIVSVPVILAALIALAAPAAAETAGYEVTPCQENEKGRISTPLWVFVGDKDPAGLNVRSGPGTGYPVVKTIPTGRTAAVSITGSSGGWFHIDYVRICDEDKSFKSMELAGWVSGSLLQVRVIYEIDAPLFSEPRKDSTIVTKVPGGTLVTLSGCRCDSWCGWLEVRYEEFQGWIRPDHYREIVSLNFCDQ